MDTIIQILAPVAILLAVAASIYIWFRVEGKIKWYNESIQQITEKAILRFQQSTMRIVTEYEDDGFLNDRIKITDKTKKEALVWLDKMHTGSLILVHIGEKEAMFDVIIHSKVRAFHDPQSIKGTEPDFIVMGLTDCTPGLLAAARAHLGKSGIEGWSLILCTR